MKTAQMKKYVVEVTRAYTVTALFDVIATDEKSATEAAEELSGNEDYTGQLMLDYVVSDIYSEEPIY